MFGRLLGRAWGGDLVSRGAIIALLLGGWLLYAAHGICKPRPVVAHSPPHHFRTHPMRLAAPPVAPAPVAGPQYFAAAPVPVYSYNPSAAAMYAYLQQQNYYARQFPAQPMMWPHPYAFAGRGFGFAPHGFGGHFGHGGRR